jgi:hypothetical protein
LLIPFVALYFTTERGRVIATYYVRIGGNDASAGTSAGTAWRTVGKLLGATGMASGDTAYIGAGVFREAVTVAMTSAVADTFIIGDVDGAQTGDAGEVILTNYLNGWNDAANAGDVINLAARDFLTFRNLTMIAGSTGNAIDGSTTNSTNIVIDKCYIAAYSAVPILYTGTFAAAATWTVQNSYVFAGNNSTFTITLPTGTGADYDVNFQVNDCLLFASGAATSCFTIVGSAALANKGGGVDLNRCTFLGGTSGINVSGTLLSTSLPSTVTDSLIFNGGGLTSGALGQLTDLGGNVTTGSFTNVTAHATSRTTTHTFPVPLLSFGHEHLWGMQPRRAFAPYLPGSLGRGHLGSTNTDMENRARPEGTGRFIDSGTATSATTTTLTQTGKTWGTNEHAGRILRTTGGTGANQVKKLVSNTATVLTPDTVWSTTPDATTTYVIYEGPPAVTATATAGTTTTFTVASAAWSTNKWAGYTLSITAGTNSGSSQLIVSNTATVLTTAAFASAHTTSSVGSIYWPGTSLSHPGDTPGALEIHDTAAKETTTTDAGSVGLVITGPGSHEFLIPVDATSTTISVKMQYDASHGTTNKPRAILVANGEIGITTQTLTMTSAAGSWETLTFTPQTPTAKGVVTVRLESRSDAPYGRCYADTWGIS